jgi:hypothetical protein
MKSLVLILLVSLLLLLPILVMAQEAGSIGDYPLGKKGWMFDVATAVPLMKIVESSDSYTEMDVVPIAGLGGGLCIYWTDVNVIDHKKIVSFNVPMFYASTRIDDEKKLDLTVAATVGFFDNLVEFGAGYELGKLPYERSRLVGLFSLGVSF